MTTQLSLYRAGQTPATRATTIRVRKSVLIWLSMLVFGVLLLFVVPEFLPIHYKFDAQMIREFIVREFRPTSFVVMASYANTAYVYMIFGIEDDPVLGAWFTYLTAWASVLVALLLARSGGRLWLWFPAFVWHALLLIYTCVHSKEVHAMPALALLLLLCGTRYGWLRIAAIVAAVAGYAAYFRPYWAVVGLLAAAFIVLRRRMADPGRLALAMAGAYLLLFASYYVATGQYLTDFRVGLTAGRDLDHFSDTAFPNRFDNDGLISDIGNAVYAFVRLIVPLWLLGSGKAQHLVFVVWELANVTVFAWAFARVWRVRGLDARTEFAAAWILAFSLTQGIFEPDYGTFLRHQTTLLPAFALLCLNAFWRAEGSSPAPARATVSAGSG
ncbi:MAG: hypothetical protein ABI812_00710 [Betaproteobacteria bacterium]